MILSFLSFSHNQSGPCSSSIIVLFLSSFFLSLSSRNLSHTAAFVCNCTPLGGRNLIWAGSVEYSTLGGDGKACVRAACLDGLDRRTDERANESDIIEAEIECGWVVLQNEK